uniref:Uncharacterized protein n=1 Tax=Amphimedon queenslandica TaxID=400682 RepID=A0A1X7VXU3_AMPQE
LLLVMHGLIPTFSFEAAILSVSKGDNSVKLVQVVTSITLEDQLTTLILSDCCHTMKQM